MADKSMYLPNDDTQNYPFCRLELVIETLETQLNESTNHNSLKSPKVLSQRIRKRNYKTLETSGIYIFFCIIVNSRFFNCSKSACFR